MNNYYDWFMVLAWIFTFAGIWFAHKGRFKVAAFMVLCVWASVIQYFAHLVKYGA